MALEQEIKLAYPSTEAARLAVAAAGARLVVSRRLLDDRLFDTHDFALRAVGQTLRVRRDGDRAVLTWKGATEPGPVKTREEIETGCADANTITAILGALGYVPCFRSQKYREEYTLGTGTVTVDEAPFGVFVEIEAGPADIAAIAARLGRTAADYELASYGSLWRRWCAANGAPAGDMVFDDGPIGVVGD